MVKCDITGIALLNAKKILYGYSCRDVSYDLIENYVAYLACPDIGIIPCSSSDPCPNIESFSCNFNINRISILVGATLEYDLAFTLEDGDFAGGEQPFSYLWEFDDTYFDLVGTSDTEPILKLRIKTGIDLDLIVFSIDVTVVDVNNCTDTKSCVYQLSSLFCSINYLGCFNPHHLAVDPLFNITWDNSSMIDDDNSLAARVSHRQRSVGGLFISVGYTPDNNMDKAVTAAIPPTLLDNVVYQFKVENICNINGPTPNDNGIIEQIRFACIDSVTTPTVNTIRVQFDLTGTDITRIALTLRLDSDSSLVFATSITNGDYTFTGLLADTEYDIEYEMFATINNVEVRSSDAAYLGNTCFTASTVTLTNACLQPSAFVVSANNIL